MKAIKNANFFIKLFNWEYWPIWAVYFPIFFYYFFLSVKARSFFFLTAANPAIENGGFGGDSKSILLDQLDEELTPQSIQIDHSTSVDWVKKKLSEKGLNYPLIIKPERGQRGWFVQKLRSHDELEAHLSKHNINFIIQEYIDHPEEYAVLYYKYPDQEFGNINSVCKKEFLSVTGDGKSSLKELILAKPRAKLQYKALNLKYGFEMKDVIAKDEKITINTIGNHCKGTAFLNYNHLINKQMIKTFGKITTSFEGVSFCRYDLKCSSENDLYTGKNMKIVEINGVGAEPAHIYDPDYKLMQAWKDLIAHWKIIYQISLQNKALGFRYPTLTEANVAWKKYMASKKSVAS